MLAALVLGTACSKSNSVSAALQPADTSAVNLEAVLATDIGPQPAEPAKEPEAKNVIPPDSGAARAGLEADPFVRLADVTSDPELRAVFEEIVRDPPTKAQAEKLRAKGQAGIQALTRALWCENPNLRLKVAALFAELEPPATPEIDKAFVRALLYEPLPAARGNTARALVDYKLAGAVAALIEVLEHDKDANARSHSAYALGAMRSQSAVPALAKALRDTESWVRIRAATALGRCSGLEAKQALTAALRDPNDLVRDAAKRALGKVK
ncbi:MAG: HEAT repeat domain-containing protein [Deltaproteobacteria bacterium]|nr:HEAT repeat domain-containing protein [Deltaproteobacteria bacterium]